MTLISFIWELGKVSGLVAWRSEHLRGGRLVRALALIAPLALLAGGCGGSSSAESAPDRFDASRAWGLVKLQLERGQRPAGSPQLRKLAAKLRPLLPAGQVGPRPGEPGLRNVVGTLPGKKPGIVVAAHYDTLAKPRGFVGANNGAAGSAVVIEVARALERMSRGPDAREVRFVLFDGEGAAKVLPDETAHL